MFVHILEQLWKWSFGHNHNSVACRIQVTHFSGCQLRNQILLQILKADSELKGRL